MEQQVNYIMISMARSYISTMIEYGFNEVSTNFDRLTSHINQEVKLLWNAILIACRLSMEVSRQTSMFMVNIILDGGENRFRFLKEATKKAGITILTLGRTLRHVFMSYWDNSDPDAFDLLFNLSRYVPLDPNVNLQDVLDPILEHSAAEEHSNQSSSGNSNEESEDTESSEELSNRSSSGQRTSNEESRDTGPSEEHSNQSSSSPSSKYYLRSSNQESEDTESSEKHSNQSSPLTHNEESETSEDNSNQSNSDRRTPNENSEEEHSEQSNSGGFWWIPY